MVSHTLPFVHIYTCPQAMEEEKAEEKPVKGRGKRAAQETAAPAAKKPAAAAKRGKKGAAAAKEEEEEDRPDEGEWFTLFVGSVLIRSYRHFDVGMPDSQAGSNIRPGSNAAVLTARLAVAAEFQSGHQQT